MIVGIVGLGLMGGSIAKGLKRKKPNLTIVAYDATKAVLTCALSSHVIDQTATEDYKAFHDCDIVFICTPVDTIASIAQKLDRIVKPTCILTDIGSVKGCIMAQINQIGLNHAFIGGHPMVGSEKKGYEYSNAILLENAYYMITPSEHADDSHIEALQRLLTDIGAMVLCIDPQHHDLVTAAISHLPHVIASALVMLVQKSDDEKQRMHKLAAGGFRDITRIASSAPQLWQSVCLSNRQQILPLLQNFIDILSEFSNDLTDGAGENLYDFFEQSKKYRDSFEARPTGMIEPVFELHVSVEDKPGVIADIARILADHSINIKNIGILHNREGFEGVLRIEFYDHKGLDSAVSVLRNMSYAVHVPS